MLFCKAHILHQLHSPEICACCIPHRHIGNQHGFSVFLHPDRHFVERSFPEFPDDVPHLLLHFRGWQENTSRSIAMPGRLKSFSPSLKKAVDIVLIDKCDLQRNRVEHCGKRATVRPARHDNFFYSFPYFLRKVSDISAYFSLPPPQVAFSTPKQTG